MADDDRRQLRNDLLCRRFGLVRIASVIDRAVCELLPEEPPFALISLTASSTPPVMSMPVADCRPVIGPTTAIT
jgi:hypothetical protein